LPAIAFHRLFAIATLGLSTIALPVLASVQYRIDEAALTSLSGPIATGTRVRVHDIPVDGKPETLELERFEVFTADSDIKVLGANDEVLEQLAPPSIRLYRGAIAGDPDSLAFISVASGRIDGVVFKGERRFGIGSRRRAHRQRTRDGDGYDVFIEESDPLSDLPADGRGFTCDLDGSQISRMPSLSPVVDGLQPSPDGSLATASARWVLNMAVETDYELYQNVGSSSPNVTTFITNLIGAVSTIYNRELNAEVLISSLTINSSVSDPFTIVPGTNGTWNGIAVTYAGLHALLEFGDRWHNSPPSANPRSVTALISGKPQFGGTAWINVLCRNDFLCSGGNCGAAEPYDGHYGGRYSFNGGIFPPGNPPVVVPDPDANAPTYTAPASNYWPLLEVAHETGHNVFSKHTHCLALSAIDQVTFGRTHVDYCSSSTSAGCYNSSNSVPAEKGTIMSYCHFFGATQTRFIFGKVGEASYVVPAAMKNAIQTATPNLSAITAPANLDAGASGTASVTNVGGLTYLWTITNGVIDSGQGTSSINFTANTNPTNVKIRATNATGCSITDNKDVTVISTFYNPPASVTAIATSTTSVSVSWSAPGGTTPVQYDVYRSSDNVIYTQVGVVGHPTTVFADHTASPGIAYLYKVRSAGSAGTSESTDSNVDLATAVLFADDPLVAGTTLVQAAHITQLGAAVDAVRTLASLGAGSYADGTVITGTTLVKAAHLTDLRTALDAARSTLALSALSCSEETITASTTMIKGDHITELRNGVK